MKFLAFALIVLALDGLLCIALGAAARLAVWERARWELVSVFSTSAPAMITPWLSPGAAGRLLGWELPAGQRQAAGEDEQKVLTLLAVVVIGLAHGMCVPVRWRWSWVVPVSSGCSFLALVSLDDAPRPQTLALEILLLLLFLLLSLAGAWSRDQLIYEVQTHVSECCDDEAGDEKPCEIGASENELQDEQKTDAERAWPDCSAILPGSRDESVHDMASTETTAALDASLPMEKCQSGESDAAEDDQLGELRPRAHSAPKAHMQYVVANSTLNPSLSEEANHLKVVSMESMMSWDLTESEMEHISMTVGTQTEPSVVVECGFKGLGASMVTQASSAKDGSGTHSESTHFVSEPRAEIEKASMSTQTERDVAGTSDAAVNTSIQWSEAGFSCRDCARPPKLPGPPQPRRRRSKQRRGSASQGDNGSSGSSGSTSDTADSKYDGSEFDGIWAIHEDLAEEASGWLRCMHIKGGDVVLGDGSMESIVVRSGHATLLEGVLEVTDGQLYRVGKSGRTAVFCRGVEQEEGSFPQRVAVDDEVQEDGTSGDNDDNDDDMASLVSFVQALEVEVRD